MSFFNVVKFCKNTSSRVGLLNTAHGQITTPAFMPIATYGAIKTLSANEIKQINYNLILSNTYHLYLRPGMEVLDKFQGLHNFMKWDGAILTDSGGFQVFSLAYGSVAQELKSQGTKSHKSGVLKIEEEGVWFRSYRDGQKVHLTPESSVMAQKELGADIIIPLDELPPFHIGAEKLFESFHRTHRWQARSLATHLKNPNNQAMYGVVHGGVDMIFYNEH